ncbi:MAG: OmpA family protein [Thiobacillus sp.]|nr:OmpA family protein [Thiobacillus sp.]
MRTPLVLSLLSTALLSLGAVNAQAADPYFYDPSNVGAGVYKPETIHSPDAVQVPSTTGKDLARTIGCPGRALLDKSCAIEDADKDTVEDWTDKCPGTPAGMKVNALGCEIDTDGDGVLDSVDKCPTVYAQTADGCPPVAAAAPESAPAPAPAPAAAPADKPIMTFEDVNFDFDKATLRPTAAAKIDKAVAYVKETEGEFELKGYADSIGSEAYNLKLSQKRADAVRNAMVKKGAPADRITAKGYGEASPAASNSTKAGRAQNRRVELWGANIEQVKH